MTSYLVYLLAARATNYLGVYKRGSMLDTNTWTYIVDPLLLKKKLQEHSKEYRIINDPFIFSIIQFIEGDYAKRMSKEATTKIFEVGAYYIQY